MNKISDHNLIHKDVLEITETEIEDKVYNLRQRHSADNVFYSKGVQRGYTEQQLRSEYPHLEDKLFDSTEFHTGAYYMKRYMLEAMYNYLSAFHKMEVGNLDIVIGKADTKSKPILEVKYYEQQVDGWIDMLDDCDVEHRPPFFELGGEHSVPLQKESDVDGEPKQLELDLKPKLNVVKDKEQE